MTYQIERNLTNHPPSPQTQEEMERVRLRIKMAAGAFDTYLPPGREADQAFAKLEEASMWAMAALARGGYDESLTQEE